MPQLDKAQTTEQVSRRRTFLIRHARLFSVLSFALGFLWDSLTLTSVGRLFDNVVLLSYLAAAFASIVLINAHGTRNFRSFIARRSFNVAEFILPFSFGGLFSGFLIFYSKSGPVLSSAPFLLFLLLLFLGNEFFRKQYERLVFQMGVFFVALFSYIALLTPVLVGRIGGAVFVLSGAATLLLFWCSFRALRLVAPFETRKAKASLWAVVWSIFFAFNFLYFNNMIPPIPLSLKEIGVYHGVERARSGEYRLTFERPPWYALLQKTNRVFHRSGNEPVFVFSSVFAPARLIAEIVHRWSYFDERTGEWKDSAVINFPILGGRDEGFRGYSKKEAISPGKWRVDVLTLRGQVIGRFVFEVVETTKTLELETATF